jgi:GTP cyclohydrolase II
MYVADVAIRPQLKIMAQAPVPTRHGVFDMIVFHWEGHDSENGLSPDHVALVAGNVRGKSAVPVRVHSECLTSEVFGSLKCDCRDQLEAAQAEITRQGQGILIYLRQEGRGIGLPNKIRAYDLQSRGHDTVDANRILGLPDDARDYSPAAAMIEHLSVASIVLMTNNPLKEQALRQLGITVEKRAPSHVGANPFSVGYLEAKRLRMGHALPSFSHSPSASASAADVLLSPAEDR